MITARIQVVSARKLHKQASVYLDIIFKLGTSSVQWDFSGKSAHIPFENRLLSVFFQVSVCKKLCRNKAESTIH